MSASKENARTKIRSSVERGESIIGKTMRKNHTVKIRNGSKNILSGYPERRKAPDPIILEIKKRSKKKLVDHQRIYY